MNFCPESKNSIIVKTARYDRIINDLCHFYKVPASKIYTIHDKYVVIPLDIHSIHDKYVVIPLDIHSIHDKYVIIPIKYTLNSRQICRYFSRYTLYS